MLGKRRWLSILLVALLATAGLGIAAAADAGTESQFLDAINSSRASAGLGPLAVDGGLTAHARNHTQDMIAAGSIYLSSGDELAAAGGSGWSRIGENVGRGGSVASLHQAFMESPGHKANILGDYNLVGIGTGSSNGVIYVTVVFMKKGSTSAPTTTSSPPTTSGGGTTQTTQPAATTTTVPTTTTTTLIVGPDKPVTPGASCISVQRLWWTCHD
jgi:hypothetical protein